MSYLRMLPSYIRRGLMEVLFPKTINKAACKTLEDTTNAGKNHAKLGWNKKKNQTKRKEGKKNPQHYES